MAEFGPQQFGKILLLTGVIISLFGGMRGSFGFEKFANYRLLCPKDPPLRFCV
jgi:hypothetical protein